MSLQTPTLPGDYATMIWSIPVIGEVEGAETMVSAAVVESIALEGSPEFITIIGNDGMVAGVQPLVLDDAGEESGTARDDEEVVITCLAGVSDADPELEWPEIDEVVQLTGLPEPWSRCDGNWVVVANPLTATRKQHGRHTLRLRRWAGIDLIED